MKKILLLLFVIISSAFPFLNSADAQVLKIMKGNEVVKEYRVSDYDEVVFREQDTIILTGMFSVDEFGKQVRFSKGNLYWDGNAYHFEANQTDYPESRDADHVGHFFWTNQNDYNSGNSSYMPYAEEYDYSSVKGYDKCFCSTNNPLTVEGTEGLFVLTEVEWAYLLYYRTNALNLRKCGVTVGDKKNCLIIAPDDFTETLRSSYTLDEINALGLVCLPAAGKYNVNMYLSEPGLCGADNYGRYWVDASYNGYSSKEYAYDVYFTSDKIKSQSFNYRGMCQSIRLVQQASETPEVTSELLLGKFSISESETVNFSSGNLYWDSSVGKFMLEARQTDYPQYWNTRHVGHFYWVSSNAYQFNTSYFKPFDLKYPGYREYTSDEFFCDRSHPLTVNGMEGFFAMSRAEWYYLLFKRENAENLCKYGVTVDDDDCCLVIAPDDFNGLLDSSYTLEEINEMGLVCLPAAGTRDDDKISVTDAYNKRYGNYWTSTPNSSQNSFAGALMIDSEEVKNGDYLRAFGRSLRLVRLSSE